MTRNLPLPRRNHLSLEAICRLEPQLVDSIAAGRNLLAIALRCVAIIAVGCSAYGFTFGLWRAPEQGLYSALKLPLLLLSIVLTTTLANGIVALLLRAQLGILQGLVLVLLSLTLASALLGSIAPISLFLVLSVPSPLGMSAESLSRELASGDPQHLQRAAQLALFGHVLVIGFCGVIGNLRLSELLRRLIPERPVATKVLVSWLIVDAFVGTQLSWILRPFLCKPGLPAALLRSDAFEGNFFEEIWRILTPFFR